MDNKKIHGQVKDLPMLAYRLIYFHLADQLLVHENHQ